MKSIYIAGKCPDHPFLNFLDSPVLNYKRMIRLSILYMTPRQLEMSDTDKI